MKAIIYASVHPETLTKSLNHIWQVHLQRLARLHVITMITNIIVTITVDMEDVAINLQHN